MSTSTYTPWGFLEQYRGTEFFGQWPTIRDLLHIQAMRFPSSTCWSCLGKDAISFTYAEAEQQVQTIADHLLNLGVNKDTHIAVTGKNSPQWAIAFMAVLYAGATVVPLDNALHENELENLLTFGDVDYMFGDVDRLDMGKAFVKEVFSLEKSPKYTYLLDLKPSKPAPEAYRQTEDDLAAILFTSGTTGNPKGVMLTHKNLVSCGYLAQCNMRIYQNDVFYAILPVHHAYTLQANFIVSLTQGCSLIFCKKLVISKVLSEMKEGKVTMFLAVPMLFNKLIAALMNGVKEKGKFAYGLIRTAMAVSGFLRKVFHINIGKKIFKGLLSKLSLDTNRICISGGGPLPVSTAKQFQQLGLDFVQGYGMTETSPITHLNPIDDFIYDSVGRNCGEIETKIVDPDSEGNGLIYIRGPQVMQGYYKNPEATAEVLSEDGWINTGDVGHLDSRNYLYLTGRKKNIIVTDGGKNVFPEEIEDMFQIYDEVEQVCIIPYMADKEMKVEGVRLLILPTEKFRETCESEGLKVVDRMNAIVDEVNSKLQRYKKITKVTVIDEALEMTSTKKIKRNVAIAKYRED